MQGKGERWEVSAPEDEGKEVGNFHQLFILFILFHSIFTALYIIMYLNYSCLFNFIKTFLYNCLGMTILGGCLADTGISQSL